MRSVRESNPVYTVTIWEWPTVSARTVTFIRSMKTEGFGASLVPLRLADMRNDLASYVAWYNEYRPHQGLAGKTPMETREDQTPLRQQFEARGNKGVKLKLVVSHFQDRQHLPIIDLQKTA